MNIDQAILIVSQAVANSHMNLNDHQMAQEALSEIRKLRAVMGPEPFEGGATNVDVGE